MSEQKKFSEKVLGDLGEHIKTHPGLIVSLGYLVWVIVGIFYLTIFYSEFNIPILKLLEVTDILLAGFQEPFVSVALLIAVFLIIFLIYSTDWYEKQREKHNKWKGKRYGAILRAITYVPKDVSIWRWSFIVILFLYFSIFLEYFVGFEIRKLHAKETSFYTLQQSGQLVRADCNEGTTDRWQLLGSTTKFVFLRSPDCDYSMVVGIENIEQLAQVETFDDGSPKDDKSLFQSLAEWWNKLWG